MLRLDMSVLDYFSAGNIATARKLVNGQRGILADNDLSKTREPQAKKAGLPFVMADTVGWDIKRFICK